MRFCKVMSTGRVCAGVGTLALAIMASPAHAEQAAPELGVDTAVAEPAAPVSRVYISGTVGRVTADRAADGAGRRMYAARNTGAGSASIVSFSSVPVAAGAVATGAVRLSSGTLMPLARSSLTSRFGVARAAANGGTRAHAGVDLAAPQGSPVAAAMAGRVAVAGWSGGYGNLVVVDHGNGVETRYAHLSSIRVGVGQQLGQGQILGLVGSTGRSTGPHLHYELRQNGRPLNPLDH
jgi:murein DD-endopeptidase MepM/ murein hydrolase activator NlpD